MRTLKNTFITMLLAGLTALSVSCEKHGEPVIGPRTEVTFAVGVPTRAAVTAHEDEVHSLDLLVFRADNGRLDAYNRVSSATTVTANLSVGAAVHYYVVANAPAGALSSFTAESDFLSGKTLLGQSTASSLLMYGAGTVTVSEGGSAVPVTLDRYVSKVSVQTVEVKWLDTFTTAPEVKIGRVALVNVLGHLPWSGTPTAGTLWYNRMNVVTVDDGTDATANVMDMICAPHDITVTDSSPVHLTESQYAQPNPTDNAVNSETDPEWSVRDTRVALELLIDGVPNWYPVDLPSMQGNRHYIVTRLVVLGPGASSPDLPVTRTDIELELTVKDWEDTDTNVVFYD